jgi:microcystin-dependent protein
MEAFLGELRLLSFSYAPKTWAQCNGQLLPINQNQALFALLGTMYGGNGQTTFALPDLRGRTPMHFDGNGYTQGMASGEEAHTLSQQELPQHTHLVRASSANADQNNPTDLVLAAANNQYHAPTDATTLAPVSVTTVGGTQAHTNLSPYLTLSWCIALQGIFPSRD